MSTEAIASLLHTEARKPTRTFHNTVVVVNRSIWVPFAEPSRQPTPRHRRRPGAAA
ncbi:MAG: hypothetical protein QOJ62_2793 [Actinomycetota bacterium]|jgi:hypothetical protein|nr:hypothetical protein [Actinomycetota bacterium]